MQPTPVEAYVSLTMALRRAAHSASRTFSLDGIFIPVTTPFSADGSINWQGLQHNLAKYEQVPFAGYVVAGSNGEAPYLNHDERLQVVKAIREKTKKIVIGGATAESTKATCELAEGMKSIGADGLLVMPPYYFRGKMSDAALSEHFKTVAERSTLPVVIYNMPIVTGIDLSIPTLAKLAQHPLIRGVKDSDIRKCAGTVQATRGSAFDVLIGSAGYLLGSLLYGCSGGINGLAGIMGKELCEIHSLYRAGKIQEANVIQNRIAKPDILFMSQLGVAGLKCSMDMLGLVGGECRRPMPPLPDSDIARVKQSLQEAGLLA